MAELLRHDKEMAASFLNSVLNQLNWAFSEFIGMIQEVRRPKLSLSVFPVGIIQSESTCSPAVLCCRVLSV